MAALACEALPFTDDLIEEILVLLPTLADLGRACAACPTFRRVITAPRFLRRLHALHAPSLLGFHTFAGGFQPVEPSHPSAAAARAFAAAADFTFSFLPALGSARWMVRDARDGRFLLDCDEGRNGTFTTFAVCDPLFRRYVLVPPIPNELTAAVKQPHLVKGVNGERRCDVFLAPSGGEDEAAAGSSESFKVIWMAQCRTKMVAFVFTSASGQWRAVASPGWRDLNSAMPSKTGRHSLGCRNYAFGCFYWLLMNFPRRSKLIAFDMGKMEFYSVSLQAGYKVTEFAIVELPESKLGMFASDRIEGHVLKLFCANLENHGQGASEWMLQGEVVLDPLYKYYMLGVHDGQLLLQRTPNDSNATEFGCFSLDFKTLQVQRIQGMLKCGYRPLPSLYAGYPPSLSLPTI